MTLLFGCYGHYESNNSADSYLNNFDLPVKRQIYHKDGIFFQSVQQNPIEENAGLYAEEPELAILADVQIFNRSELFKQLSLIPSSQISDAKLILWSYKKWGIGCLEKIIGDFAFAIWDNRKNHLFLASDPCGQRTLYYSTEANLFCFSNLIQPLLQQFEINSEFNRIHIANSFTTMPPDPTHTFFKNIQRLQAGHYLIWNPEKYNFSIQRYWSADTFFQDPLIFSKPDDYYQHFLQLFQQVISEYLAKSTRPIGCQLSGGLDSSAVTSMAAYLLQKKSQSLFTFSHLPSPGIYAYPKPNYTYSDEFYINTVTKLYPNIKSISVSDIDLKIFEYCKKLHPWLAQPTVSGGILSWELKSVEIAKQHGIHILLIGLGGNATLSWKGNLDNKSLPSQNLKNIFANFRRRIIQPYPWGLYASINPQLAQEQNLILRFKQWQQQQTHLRHINDPRIDIFNFGFSISLASYQAAIRFLYGLEHWDPTLDRRIVEFCLRIPNAIYREPPLGRGLVRKALAGVMPQIICERSSRGLRSADWYKKIEHEHTELFSLIKSWQGTIVAEFLNLDWLLRCLKQWNYQKIANSKNREYSKFEKMYYFHFLNIIEKGLFIQQHS